MPQRVLTTTLAVVLAVVLLAACSSGGAGAGAADGTPTVVATTTQVGDLARAVAGDRADVRQILRPSSDPHEYEPRPSDVRAIAGAGVVVRSGGDLDAWLGDVLDNAGSDARVVTLLDAMPTTRAEPGGEVDPHWWQNPRNGVVAVERIRAALAAADPGGRAVYDANARRYAARLRALDTAIAACMRAIPATRRRLVTDHDALGYYADRYRIEVLGTVIPALTTQAQASAGEVARLVDAIRAAGVRTIFPESSVSPKLTRAIARDAGARVGPALYADALGPTGSPGGTYLGSLRANTQALAVGFAGRRCQL